MTLPAGQGIEDLAFHKKESSKDEDEQLSVQTDARTCPDHWRICFTELCFKVLRHGVFDVLDFSWASVEHQLV